MMIMTRRKPLLWIGLCVLLFASGVVDASDNIVVYVIANSSVEITADEIADVYLGKKLIVTGIRLIPVDNATLRNEFLRQVLKLDMTTYTTIWTKKGLDDGLNPPDIKPNDAAVIAYLRRTPGAVGYISHTPASLLGLKIIQKY